MKAIVLGATGLVGSHLVRILARQPRWESVTALVRSAGSGTQGVRHVVVNFEELGATRPAFQADVAFCCLGTTIKKAGSQAAFRRVDHDYPLEAARLFRQMSPHGHFVVVTAMGSDPRSKLFYNRTKGELETALEGLGLRSLSIVRPSLLTGERSERRAGERFAIRAAHYLNPLMAGPLRKYRAISAENVALAMEIIGRRLDGGPRIYLSDELEAIARSAMVQ